MTLSWLAATNQGRMVGDYMSTSFTSDGKAHPVFSVAKAPIGSCNQGSLTCSQRLSSSTFDISGPSDSASIRARHDRVLFHGRSRAPRRRARTAN